jgi:hypothetical protein
MNRYGDLGILAALLVAVGLLCAPLWASATDILVTINGTVTSGTDYTGVFGPALLSLADKKFTLVYLINDGLLASTRQNRKFYTTIYGSSSELGGTPVQKATLTIDGQSLSLGVLPINNVSSGATRNIDGIPTTSFTMDDSYSVPGSAGYAQTGIVLILDANLVPPLAANWEEPIYFNFPPLRHPTPHSFTSMKKCLRMVSSSRAQFRASTLSYDPIV